MENTQTFLNNFVDYLMDTLESMSRSFSLEKSGEAAGEHVLCKFYYFWKNNLKSFDEIVKQYTSNLLKKAKPTLRSILEVDSVVDNESSKKLFQQIAHFISIYSLSGQPTDETNQALNSVFRASDLPEFFRLSVKNREKQIMEITQIVTGIRIFNKDCLKGGENIEDLPEKLPLAIEELRKEISNFMAEIKSRGEIFENILELTYNLTGKYTKSEEDIFKGDEHGVPDLQTVKEMMCLLQQVSYCLRQIKCWMIVSETEIHALTKTLRIILSDLHQLLKYRSAVATKQVFPLFTQLALTWRELQYQAAYLCYLSNLISELSLFCKQDDKLLVEDFLSGLKLIENTLDDITVDELKKSIHPKVQFIPYKLVDLHNHPFEMKELCPWSLIKTNGGTFRGNVNLGALQYKKKRYAFLNYKFAREWGKDPEAALKKMSCIVKEKPSIGLVLEIEFSEEQLKDEKGDNKITWEIGTQTETHPIVTHIDPNYCFSVWELRRRALKLAHLQKCTTKSTQTMERAFRLDKSVQIGPGIDKKTQVLFYDVSATSSKSSFHFTGKPN